jgi:hypothetical protein
LGRASFASSYFPTPAAAVNRAADIAVMTGSNFSDWYNEPQGTFACEFDLLAASGTRAMMQADTNSSTGYVSLWTVGTVAHAGTKHVSAQSDLSLGAVAANTIAKIAVSQQINNVRGCLNGGTVGADTSATVPALLVQLRIGYDGVAADVLNGHIRHLQFQNTALTDAELVTLTTPGPWPGGEPVPPAVGPTTTGGSAFWDQDYDDREYETSRKRRKRFLEERLQRVRDL